MPSSAGWRRPKARRGRLRKRKTASRFRPARLKKIAELYTRTVSTLGPRILVNGEQGYLANSLIAAKVRCALFAGIRAGFLWRQLGGRRWQLLFQRRAIANEAGRILETRKTNSQD